jgi:hypothetical protein
MARKKKEAATPSEESFAETARERFLRLAPQRVRRAVKAISLIGNFGGANYDSSERERDQIIAALNEAVAEVAQRFTKKKARPKFHFDLATQDD